jgi:hypothetical protein
MKVERPRERLSLCEQNGFIKVKRVTGFSAEKNITMLVLFMSILLVIHQITVQVINTAMIRMDVTSPYYNFIFIFYNFSAYLFHGANIFIYYFFNNDFSYKLKNFM